MRKRFLVLSIAIMVCGTPALAETWRAASQGPGAAAFIDTDSIQRDGDKVKFLREIRFAEVRSLQDGTRFDRIAAQQEGDCRAMTLQALNTRVLLGREVLSEDAERGKLYPAKPGSTSEADLRAACFNDWPR